MDEQKKFTVGGSEFFLSKGDVEQRLSRIQPEPIRELYVEVSNRQFPIKQAFADSTGMPRGGFTSHDAMRVFRKLNLRIGPDSATWPERVYTVLKSLNEYDKKEINGVLASVGALANTNRDTCFLGIYRRGKANVESLLSLRHVKDFQAIAMLARSIFELTVDMKLIDVVPDAAEKITAFTDVARLKTAEKIAAFKTKHPNARVDVSVHTQFIAGNKARIDAMRNRVWNGKTVEHWSGMKLRERATLLKDPFEETYEVSYPQLSWYTHSAGLTGFHLKASTYEALAVSSFQIAIDYYMIILSSVIDEFLLAKADPKIKERMRLAQHMPLTDTDEQLAALERELLG